MIVHGRKEQKQVVMEPKTEYIQNSAILQCTLGVNSTYKELKLNDRIIKESLFP